MVASISPVRADEMGLAEKWAAVFRGEAPHEKALGLYLGTAYDWSDMQFALASGQALYRYKAVGPDNAPDALGVRFEGNLGTAVGTEFSGARLVASGNFLAVYDLPAYGTPKFIPYVEGGVGLIYTDFQRKRQGLRLNFNPVAGVGVRMGSTFLTLRLHHISNGGLHHENRGLNSVVLGFGKYL
jgi:hypothetical protein